MSDFPRGWTKSNEAPSGVGVASITLGAARGVIHVLDELHAKYINEGAAGPPGQVIVVSTPSLGNLLQVHLFITAAQGDADSLDLSGLNMASGPGESMTIAFSSAATATVQTLVIKGHDI